MDHAAAYPANPGGFDGPNAISGRGRLEPAGSGGGGGDCDTGGGALCRSAGPPGDFSRNARRACRRGSGLGGYYLAATWVKTRVYRTGHCSSAVGGRGTPWPEPVSTASRL